MIVSYLDVPWLETKHLEWLIPNASLSICGGNINWYQLYRKQSGNDVTKDLKMFIAIYPAIPFLVIWNQKII